LINNPPKIDIDQLKQAVKITELAKQLGIELTRNNKALCIWHNEKTPSLSFNDEKGIYTCFGACQESGDIIALYMKVRQVEFSQAITELAEIAGLAPHQTHAKPARSDFRAITSRPPQGKPATNENKGQYSKIYEALVVLCTGLDEESEQYLKGDKRGLTDATIDCFLLCSIGNYAEINKKLKEKFSLEDLKRAGLCNDEGNLIFYKHKLLIPFLADGRIVFLQGRRLDAGEPKYLHLKGVSVPLYNTHILQDLQKGDRVYICEGVFDAMTLEQNGYNAVAILGVNNFKPEMAHQFKGFEVVLMFDNDEAGERATKEVAKIFLLNGQEAKTKRLPENIKDITDYFIKQKNEKV